MITTSDIKFIHSNDMTQVVIHEKLDSGTHIDDLQISCGSCGEPSALIRWDDRYAGYRGRCNLCKFDWPES